MDCSAGCLGDRAHAGTAGKMIRSKRNADALFNLGPNLISSLIHATYYSTAKDADTSGVTSLDGVTECRGS